MTDEKRTIVYPSQVLGETKNHTSGRGTFVEKISGKIFAERLGILDIQTFKNQKGQSETIIQVKPIKGRYVPVPGDPVIGIVEEASQSSWMVNINAPYPALLHVTEVPWDIDFGNTEKYLNHGDSIMAKVLSVDEQKKLNITLNDRNLYKIKGGTIIDVEPSVIPRIIGRKYSMVELIQKHSHCRIKVGQNGRIWIDGETEGIEKVLQAIYKIEREAVSHGLTNRIEELLKKESKEVIT